MNIKGQLDFPIITFVIIVIGIIILAPIILKIVNSTLTPLENSLAGTPGGNESGAVEGVQKVHGTFVTFWDGVLIFAFLIAVIMLFISAFLIDTHVFFVVLYVMMLFLTIVFAPSILEAVTKIYESGQFAQEVAVIPFMDFLRLNFGLVITAIGILTMIIIYAKIRFFPSNQ